MACVLFFLDSETGAGAELSSQAASVCWQCGRAAWQGGSAFHPHGVSERLGELCLLHQQEGGSKKVVSELQTLPQLPKALAKPQSGGFRASRAETAQTAVEIPTAILLLVQVFKNNLKFSQKCT